MSQKQGSSGGKHRKKGDWVALAKGRASVPRMLRAGHGLTNIPVMGEVGSAAYRRRLAKLSRRVG